MTLQRSRLNVLLVGEESAAIQLLRALSRQSDRIVAVMASPSKTSRDGASLWTAARQQGYDTWPAEFVKDPSFGDRLRSEGVDVLLNVHSLYIIHPKVLTAPRLGSFNMHPGPLPQYAGLNTVSWAIYRGEARYGVTVHEMTSAIDAGRIAYQSFFRIEETDTPLSLTLKCVQAGVPLLLRLLDTAAVKPDAIPRVGQDLTKREYFGREVPDGGWLSWNGSAKDVVNFVRACDYYPFLSPWGHPRTRIGRKEIFVIKASRTGLRCAVPPGTVGEPRGGCVSVACADEWILLHHIQANQRPIDPRLLLKPGDRLVNDLSSLSA